MDPNSDFQQKMVEYLEGAHNGEFMNSTMDNVAQQVQESNQKILSIYLLQRHYPLQFLKSAAISIRLLVMSANSISNGGLTMKLK